MPQLNVHDFAPQLVWLAITFVVLYLVMWRVALPRVGRVLEERQQKIGADLAQAERLKADADETLAAYRKVLGDARSQAQAALRDAAAAAAAEAAKREAAFAATLAEKTRAAEQAIDVAKQAALAEMGAVAAEVASAMTAKLAGTGADAAEARAAVREALAEAR